MSDWASEKEELFRRGFSDMEVFQEEQTQRNELFNRGYSSAEIDDYFGVKQFNPAPMQAEFKERLASHKAAKSPEVADNPWEAFLAGLELSTPGLAFRQEMPDLTLPENANWFYRMASSAGTLVGDIPTMIAGSTAGLAVGGAMGIETGPGALGTAVVGGAAGFALPAFLRRYMIESYKRGETVNFSDFWTKAAPALLDAAKEGTVGAVTGGVGFGAGKALGIGSEEAMAALSRNSLMTRSTLKHASEIGTMVSLGRALEGEVPSWSDFGEAAVLVTGMHLALRGAGKVTDFLPTVKRTEKTLADTYASTGEHPTKVALMAENKPELKQQLLADNPDMDVIHEQVTGEKPTRSAGERGSISSKPTKQTTEPVLTADQKSTLEDLHIPERELKVERAFSPLVKSAKDIVDSKGELRFKYVDYLQPIMDLENELSGGVKIRAEDSASEAMRTATRSTSIANGALRELDDIVAPVKGNGRLDAFKSFAVNVRALELSQRALKPDSEFRHVFSPDPKIELEKLERAKRDVEANKKEFKAILEAVVEWQNKWHKKSLVESGRIDEELALAHELENQYYIPTTRVIDPKTGLKAKGKAGFLKQAIGGESPIQDPLVSIPENTAMKIFLGEKNKAVGKLLKLVKENPEFQEWLELIKNEKKTEEQSKRLDELDATIPIKPVKFGAKSSYKLTENQFEYYDQGSRQIWEASNKNVATAIKLLDGRPEAQGLVIRSMSLVSKFLRSMITLSAEFSGANALRDYLYSLVSSESRGAHRFWENFVAFKDVRKERAPYLEFEKEGGIGSEFHELKLRYIDDPGFWKMAEETGLLRASWNVLEKGVDYVEAIAKAVETSTRLAEYKRIRAGGGSVEQGLRASRNVTVDFSKHGASVALNQLHMITAFQSAFISSGDQTIKSLKDLYKLAKTDKKEFVKVMAAGGGLITAISALNAWNSVEMDSDGKLKEKDWYKEIQPWERDLFWHIRIGEHTFRVPKPHEIGIIFGTLPERIFKATFTKEPDAWKKFGETIIDRLTPPLIPDAVKPVIEQIQNQVGFTKKPIVPTWAQKLVGPEQYTEYTSDFAKTIGKLIGTAPAIRDIGGDAPISSPMVIDNYIRSYGGTNGQYILKAMDFMIHQAGIQKDLKPSWTLSDYPFIRAFTTRYPSASSKSLDDFRDNFTKTERAYNSLEQSKKKGDKDDALWLMEHYKSDIFSLRRINQTLQSDNLKIRYIYNSNATADEKRRLIDSIYMRMIQAAKYGNEQAYKIRKVLESK